MKENVLTYVNKLEGYKTAIKNLHWSSKNMSEHKLFDDIAESVASIQDEVAEMEQGMHGQIERNKLNPTAYTIESNQKFLDDMLDATKEFHKSISGEEYIGIRSSEESFIGELNKFKYLMDLCLKEDLQRRINKARINEGEISKYPKSVKGRENLIYKAVRGARLDSMKYHDESWQALRDYDYIISSLGLDFTYWCENGGYCDYDPTDHMARSKEYKIKITFPDGFAFGGYIKMMAAGTVEDPFSAYDTCIVLWPYRDLEENTITVTTNQIRRMVIEAVGDYHSEMVDGARKEKMIKDKVKEGLMKVGFTGFWGEKELSFCVSINEIDDVSIIERIAVRESKPKSYNDCRVELLPSGFGCMVIIPAWTHSNLFN